MNKIINFNAGPSKIPETINHIISKDVINWESSGMSVLELSHRSNEFISIYEKAQNNLRKLLNIPDNYKILFMQGGGYGQFSAIPMNLLSNPEDKADYIITGYWSEKAYIEAQKYGNINIVIKTVQDRIPYNNEINYDPTSKYLYYCSNETIDGVQFDYTPDVNIPLVCDMSSDFLSKPIDVTKYGIIFAGAQKNVGIPGMSIVIINEKLLNQLNKNNSIPSILHYKLISDNGSMFFNTPPTFQIYVSGLIFDWLLKKGGLEAIQKENEDKAKLLYNQIDNSNGFYINNVKNRSKMNVIFQLRDKELTDIFLKKTNENGFVGLQGHRSMGGLRASIYNAITIEEVQKLCDFMDDFMDDYKM